MRKENKLVEESLAFVKAYMADKSNDNYGSHYQLELDYAYEDGQKEGMEKGIEKGMVKGMEKANLDNAKKMKENGIPYDLIAKITGLSIDKINSLREKCNCNDQKKEIYEKER